MQGDRPILYNYFESTSQVLISQYRRSSQQRAATNLAKNREAFCQEFLLRALPSRLSIRSGEIWDSVGHKTGQLDLIILRDDAPALHIGSDDVFLAEGAFATIEVKSNLDRRKLREAGRTLEQVAKLQIPTSKNHYAKNPIERPLRIVFAYEGATWETLADEMIQHGWHELFDLICILNRGVLISKGGLFTVEGEGKHWLSVNGEAASLAFLYYYLVTYGVAFLALGIDLKPYFQPFEFWNTPKRDRNVRHSE